MEWDEKYNSGPAVGPWDEDVRGINRREVEGLIEERAVHYAETHPDPPDSTGLASLVRRIAGRLRDASSRNRSVKAATSSGDVWAHEEALYAAKKAGEQHDA